ncbi:MAG: hypothetical protein H0V82_06040 [Candidatus Protochlamydia sp.]|nr:hypothetical protein [Candidatus Protochlamydia sp.]
MDQNFNIFDEAAKQGGRPHKMTPKPGKASSPPVPANPFGLERKVENELLLEELDPNVMKLSDVEKMITTVRQMHDEIDRKLDDIFQKSGWSTKQIKMYLDNPNNFSAEEWERIQKERKTLLNSIKTDTDLENEKNQSNKPKEPEGPGKERRGKMIGARRNWIPMR